MVCIYCGHKTSVSNSRPQKRRNSIWRRRHCTACGAIFTSVEQADYDTSLVFVDATSHIVPFCRDELFVSLYLACRHRSSATRDANELTSTVIRELLRASVRNGAVARKDVTNVASQILGRFDHAAQVVYDAYHRP